MNFIKKIQPWLPWLLLLLGAVIAYYLLYLTDSRPTADIRPQKRLRLVQVEPIKKNSVTPYWDSSGYVTAKNAIKLYARVSGFISQISSDAFPGNELKKGDWLASLEQQDLALTLANKQAQLQQAEANLSLELADQMLAKEELTLLTSRQSLEFDQDLVLRKPQLTVAQAKVKVAQSEVDKASLNLARSKIVMPFDGIISNRSASIGTRVSAGTNLFEIVDTSTYWLEVKIPHTFLPLLDKSKNAILSQPRLWGKGVKRTARVLSVLPELDSKDRQVKVLLEIDQPISQDSHSLPSIFINDFVNVRLVAKPLVDAWVIKHHWLQPDGSIWVVDQQSKLQKRSVEIVFKGRDYIYVTANFQQGDMALAEKPGIASANLPVKTRRKGQGRAGREKPPKPMLTQGK